MTNAVTIAGCTRPHTFRREHIVHHHRNLTHHTTRSMAALAFACAFLMTGCGSDDGGRASEDEKIAGADDGSRGAESSPAKESPGTGAPKFVFPDDLKLSFEDARTGDAGKDEILRVTEYAAKARVEAYTKADPATKNMVRYWKHPALQFWGKDITRFAKDGKTYTGSLRYYDFEVTDLTKKAAWVRYCESQRNAFAKDRKSGKTLKTKHSKDDFVAWKAGLVKGSDKQWQVTQTQATKGATECQP
ncbi:hypothetical protein [Streptomyces reniochalinae]|uniref:Uncharacterized protein n=1 Tax=Streptomyces reniochalinae TaxID=2250578 RepID=A0A367E7V6_9ACTN|nr:hypothetical protein [Streptomyces reniochalinae]RCG13320.1 hypothetical protein DQ392_33040 [Streptomyces reniochalinae]